MLLHSGLIANVKLHFFLFFFQFKARDVLDKYDEEIHGKKKDKFELGRMNFNVCLYCHLKYLYGSYLTACIPLKIYIVIYLHEGWSLLRYGN